MSKSVTVTKNHTLPSQNDGSTQLRESLDRFYGSIEKDGLQDAMPMLPTPSVRSELVERQRCLRTLLRPISEAMAERDRAKKSIAFLLGGYLNIKSENKEAIVEGYTAHVSKYPVFAIVEACADFANHRVVDRYDDEGNPVMFTLDHAPSAFRLLDQVKKRTADAQEEAAKIERVLAITTVKTFPTISKQEADRIQRGFEDLAKSLSMGANSVVAGERDKIRAEAQDARDRAAKIKEDAARLRSRSFEEVL